METWPAHRGGSCSFCGFFLAARPHAGPPAACPSCPGSPGFDLALSLFPYEGIVREGIRAAKYGGRSGVAGPIAARLFDAMRGDWSDRFPARYRPTLVPVPIRPAKYFRRGFNFPALLALALGRLAGWPCEPRLLRRVRSSRPQAGLPLAARERNVKGAFLARPGKRMPPELLLLDDVYTSGATASSCARALKTAGAGHIVVLTVARAVL